MGYFRWDFRRGKSWTAGHDPSLGEINGAQLYYNYPDEMSYDEYATKMVRVGQTYLHPEGWVGSVADSLNADDVNLHVCDDLATALAMVENEVAKHFRMMADDVVKTKKVTK